MQRTFWGVLTEKKKNRKVQLLVIGCTCTTNFYTCEDKVLKEQFNAGQPKCNEDHWDVYYISYLMV